MVESKLLHNIEILDAAMPYISSDIKPMVELVAKGFELAYCIQKTRTSTLTACDVKKQKFSLDGIEPLLSGIRPVCNKKERAIVDQILSMINAKRMFEMYNTYMAAMQSMEDNNDFDADNSSGSNEGMMEMLKSMIPPEQQDTIENLSMLFESMSYDNSDNENETKE